MKKSRIANDSLPRVGAYVLETLTTGMYIDPLDTVREFVQNACDSIREAEQSGVLRERGGRIKIDINPNTRCLTITDNGMGLREDDVRDKLISVGMSEKQIATDAGFRGIGRLAGIAYCERLKLRTSVRGKVAASTVEFDCTAIRNAIAPTNRRRFEMAEVLGKHTQVSRTRVGAAEHFFEVSMERIDKARDKFLDAEALETYLSQVAPVDYDPQDFVCASKIRAWVAKNLVHLPVVELVITSPRITREVLKPYRNRHRTSHARGGQYDIEIKDVAFYPDKVERESKFWLWYGKTELLGTCGDDTVAGFRLRKHNIALGGPERVAEVFGEKATSNWRFNGYYVGEIHILCPEAIPNAPRDGLENVGSWPQIRRELLPFVAQRSSEAQRASSTRHKPAQKLARSAEAVLSEVDVKTTTGLASVEERDKLLAKVRTTREGVKDWLKQHPDSKEIGKVKPLVRKLTSVEGKLEDDKNFVAKKVRPSLDRKQRKLLQDVVKIVHSTLEGQACRKAAKCSEAVRKAISKEYGSP